MKTFFKKYISLIIIAVMLLMLIPGIVTRTANETGNDNVVISVLYNEWRNTLSKSKLEEMMKKFKAAGIDNVSIMEDDLNSLAVRGLVEAKRYNVLKRSTIPEEQAIADAVAEACDNVENYNYVVTIRDDVVKERLKTWFPTKYTENDYALVEDVDGNDVYVLFDSGKELWDYALGYREDEINALYNQGFKISLIFKVKNYPKTEYLKSIDEIVKKYNVEYLNLKADSRDLGPNAENEQNYKSLINIINKNNLTLVLTENADQLSNQKFLSFNKVMDAVLGEGGSGKVIRAYESYDNTHYNQRTEQLFNSTVDRNIRFIVTTFVEPPLYSYADCADYTLDCMKAYAEKIKANGFTVNEDTQKFNYRVNNKLYSAACAVIMLMALLIMIEIIIGKKSSLLTLVALILSALAFGITFILPQSIVSLYPSVYCFVMSCFTITVLLHFIDTKKDKLNLGVLTLCSVLITVGILLIGSLGMGTMLSGVNYYINNDIFRGTKFSLIIPVIYAAIVYYFIFLKNSNIFTINNFKKILFSEIKVYWVIIAAIIGYVVMYYITRSGNVSQISVLEQTLRNTVAEIFPARPRTKEFLIGYPSLILFVYYSKKTDLKLLQWAFAIGASILVASITNSFCHVFTAYAFIVNRVLNGIIVGALVSVLVFLINLAIVKLVKLIIKKYNKILKI